MSTNARNPTPAIVQFAHPGPEHECRDDVMLWNRSHHKRKFVRSDASYVTGGRKREGVVCFWTEWEPPSRIVHEWSRSGALPRALHEPFWHVPGRGRKRQNTDPLVFGSRFLFTNCRQAGNQKLRNLARGSLILFGSRVRGAFVLDTVFVVAKPTPYEISQSASLTRSKFLQSVVFEPLRLDGVRTPRLVMYEGATYEDPVHGMYSFVPCRPGALAHFARPRLRLGSLLDHNLGTGARVKYETQARVQEVWRRVVNQVTKGKDKLCLGVELPEPPRGRIDDEPEAARAERC